MLKMSCALVAVLVVLVGCGGDDDEEGSTTGVATTTGVTTTDAKAEFIAEADEICAGVNRRLKGITDAVENLEPDDNEGRAEQARKAVTIKSELARDLRKLPRPADDAEIRQYLAGVAEQISLLRRLAHAMEERHLEATLDLIEEGKTTYRDIYGLARGYGFKECGVGD
jgi:hypothetical protein